MWISHHQLTILYSAASSHYYKHKFHPYLNYFSYDQNQKCLPYSKLFKKWNSINPSSGRLHQMLECIYLKRNTSNGTTVVSFRNRHNNFDGEIHNERCPATSEVSDRWKWCGKKSKLCLSDPRIRPQIPKSMLLRLWKDFSPMIILKLPEC